MVSSHLHTDIYNPLSSSSSQYLEGSRIVIDSNVDVNSSNINELTSIMKKEENQFFPTSPEPYTVIFSSSISAGIIICDSEYPNTKELLDITSLSYKQRQSTTKEYVDQVTEIVTEIITTTNNNKGIFVADVEKNSPADKAGKTK